jgi:hypothetical protein
VVERQQHRFCSACTKMHTDSVPQDTAAFCTSCKILLLCLSSSSLTCLSSFPRRWCGLCCYLGTAAAAAAAAMLLMPVCTCRLRHHLSAGQMGTGRSRSKLQAEQIWLQPLLLGRASFQMAHWQAVRTHHSTNDDDAS